MTGEINTPLTGGTDEAISESDTTESWDYFDPEEDTEESQPETVTDEGETAEGETPEAEDQTEETEEAGETPVEADLKAIVHLEDGTQSTVEDLLKGNLRQSDYTRKMQSLSSERQAFEADTQRFEGVTQAFIDHLSSMVPAEPNPSLALTDPNRYTAQKAQYDAAIAQVQKLIEIGSKPKEIASERMKEEHSRRVADENVKLAELFPKTATKAGRDQFWSDVSAVAREVGFNENELKNVIDHRVFALAHWAKVGMDSEKAKAKARAKAEAAPPATPRKPGQPATKANRNAEAMQKLRRSGSMRDALAVDFD